MLTKSLAGMGAAALLLMAGGPALGQNVRPTVALTTSSYGAMSCSSFLALGPGGQQGLVRHMVQGAPPSSLSTTAPSLTDNQSGVAVQLQQQMNAPPLSAGQLVAACQAAPGTATLREAYAYQNSAPVPDQLVGY
jgi:hypothetical protein